MNALGFLTIFFGLIAIGLFIALTEMIDRKAHKRRNPARARIGVVRPPPDLQTAALALVEECELLEQRNDWLEWRMSHCQNVVAMSMAQSRIPRRDKTRMEVAETGRMP